MIKKGGGESAITLVKQTGKTMAGLRFYLWGGMGGGERGQLVSAAGAGAGAGFWTPGISLPRLLSALPTPLPHFLSFFFFFWTFPPPLPSFPPPHEKVRAGSQTLPAFKRGGENGSSLSNGLFVG